MTQFNRIASVILGEPGTDGLRVSDLRIKFNIQKNDSAKSPNVAKIEIYNLSQDSRDRIYVPSEDEKDTKQLVYLNAGYVDGDGEEVVFVGNVVNIKHVTKPPYVITVIDATDGEKEILTKKVSKSFKAGTSAKNVMNTILAEFGIGNDISNLIFTDKKYANGFSFAGSANIGLSKVLDFLNLDWSIQNNEIKIVPFDGVDTARAISLNPSTGLVGSPEKLQGKKRKAKGKSKDIPPGWKIISLLRPKIIPGSRIVISSNEIPENSFFKVSSVQHVGDTHGKEWQSITEVRE